MIEFLFHVVPHVPVLVVLNLAGILAITRRSSHPQVSILVMAFVVIEIVLLAAGIGLNLFLPRAMTGYGYRPSDLAVMLAIAGVVRHLLHALALGLIVWAALGWRTEASRA
jgi:hypothetical protein